MKCKNKKKLKAEKIKEMESLKMNLVIEKQIPNLPQELVQFYYAVKLSNVTDIINYEALRQYFKKLL